MRHSIRFLTLIFGALLVSQPALAQGPYWPNKAFGGRPEGPIGIDFGIQPRGARVERQLEMRNIWKVPIEITEIRISCGCTEVVTELFDAVTKRPLRKLMPDEAVPVHFKVDGARYEQPVSVFATVSGGPKFVAAAHFVVTANFRQDITMAPNELRFDSVKRGQAAERSLVVEYTGKGPWQITEMLKGAKAPFDLTSEVLPARQKDDTTILSYRIIATMKRDAPLGAFRETIDLKTNDPKQQLTFLVAGTVAPPVEVYPEKVIVTNLRVGVPVTTKIVVAGSEKFQITGVVGGNDEVQIAIPQGPATVSYILDVQLSPKTAGQFLREIFLETNLRNEKVRVVFQGNVN